MAKNASDAAAERERAKDAPVRFKPANSDEPGDGPRRRYQIDLLTFEPAIVRRLRLQSPFQELLKSAVFQRRSSLGKDGVEEDRDRRDVLRVLSYERPLDLSEARRLVESRWDSDDLEPPLLLIVGEARPTFDEVETLRTTVAITGPLGPTDKRIQACVTQANEALASNPAPTAEKCLSLTRQLEQAATSLSLPAKFVQTQVERTLLENRKFKKRQLWGTERFRIELSTAGAEALPVYIDDAASGHWPLLPAIPVVLIGELRPREDAAESSPEAFLVRALGRILAARANM